MLVDRDSAVSGYPQFGSPIAVGEAIKKAGFDVAVGGNNHALDKGIYGIDVTTSFYEENGITCVGIQNSLDDEYIAVRVMDGVNGHFRTRRCWHVGVGERADKHLAAGLLTNERGRLRLSRDSLFVSDMVMADLMMA